MYTDSEIELFEPIYKDYEDVKTKINNEKKNVEDDEEIKLLEECFNQDIGYEEGVEEEEEEEGVEEEEDEFEEVEDEEDEFEEVELYKAYWKQKKFMQEYFNEKKFEHELDFMCVLTPEWTRAYLTIHPEQLSNQKIIQNAWINNLLDLLDPCLVTIGKLELAWDIIFKYELWIENIDGMYWDKLANLIDSEYKYILM
jgi:hypothetical protein